MTWLAWACFAAAALCGAAALYALWRVRADGRLHARARSGWVQAEATVTAASLRVTAAGRTLTMHHHYPQVRYTFVAGGRTYEADRPFLCRRSPFDQEDEAQRWLAAHQPGTRRIAYYDPRDPASSALELNPPDLGALLTAATAMAALAVALVAFGLRSPAAAG